MKAQEVYMFIFFIKISTCEYDQKEASKSKNPLPYYRRYVETTPEETTSQSYFNVDANSNLVSYLVKNVKEIFDEIADDKGVEIIANTRMSDDYLPTTSLTKVEDRVPSSHTDDVMLYENLSITNLLDHNLIEPLTAKEDIEKVLKSELMHLTKEMKSYEKADLTMGDVTALTSISSYVLEITEQPDQNERDSPKRTCIFCNNVNNDKCNDPRNKLIPSITCARDSDLCYSQHTPFGVIDRGCFSVNHNLTTYVCSCNLCNYISISEMPYIFSNKQDWVDNVVELSRTRNFRKSVFKDMSCLQCEVNTTTMTGDMLDSANCLEGNVGNLPIQDCEENEICAVKTVKSDGYIWRGCVRAPLYNYWWALCETDLCNHDSVISIYDFIYTRHEGD